jgi:hypothetical protein
MKVNRTFSTKKIEVWFCETDKISKMRYEKKKLKQTFQLHSILFSMFNGTVLFCDIQTIYKEVVTVSVIVLKVFFSIGNEETGTKAIK